MSRSMVARAVMSRPVWGAWIEIASDLDVDARIGSRPVWGAWIEMRRDVDEAAGRGVAPRMGRVD